MHKIAIVDDSFAIRETLRNHFAASEKIECVFDTDTVERFLGFCRSNRQIDLVLMDINLPSINGIEGIGPTKKLLPNAQVIMYSVEEDNDKIFQALCAGADGYLLKIATPAEIERQLVSVFEEDGSAVSPAVARRMVNYFNASARHAKKEEERLTASEMQVVHLLVDAYTYQEIAEQLGITVHGVRYHIRNLYKKLQVNSRSEVAKKFTRKMF